MYGSENFRTWEHIVKDDGVKVLLVSSLAIYEQIKHFKEEISTLEHIYIIDTTGEQSMSFLEEIGEKKSVPSTIPAVHDIASLIYYIWNNIRSKRGVANSR